MTEPLEGGTTGPENGPGSADTSSSTGEVTGYAAENWAAEQERIKQEEESAINPAWTPVLDKLPEPFQKMIQPDLRSYDREIQQRFEKVKPYEPFFDRKPEQIEAALRIAKMMDESPQIIYERLGQFLGQNTQQSQQQVQQQQQPNPQQDPQQPPEFSLDEDPQLAELKRQNELLMRNQQAMSQSWNEYQQQLQQQAAQQQQEQLTSDYQKRIDSTLASLKQKHGDFDVDQVLLRANADMQRGLSFDLERNFREQMEYEASIISRGRPRDNAPLVMPASGGVPSPYSKSPEDFNADDRAEVARRLIEQMNSQGA